MVSHGVSWCLMVSHGVSWCLMVCLIDAADGPTPVMVFQASVEAKKWARKDEADYAVSLSHRLGF